jgi:xanthine dehydrogenase large subunit
MKGLPHDSSITHVAGESEFIDDRPAVQGELHVGVITSQVAHGRIKKISFQKALELPGVVGVYTGKDLHHNIWGTIIQDEPVLATDEVNYYGEAICIVACEDRETLRHAKKLIRIEIDPLPAILSIEQARAEASFVIPPRYIERGDVKKALAAAPRRKKGVITMAGQEHFYLESQASVVYPGEQGQIVVHTSSQHPTEVQHVVAHCLGLHYHQVVTVVKRMGGGFGGKESQAVPFAVMGALVAQKTGRAARVVISKDDDMLITGKRNPFENHYEVGFDDNGKILALNVEMYSNSGAYADLSTSIIERAMLHVDNAYSIENIRIMGQVCKTHQAPTTAFRGFGGPKGVATIENIIEDIATYLKKDALDIRELNCYKGKNNITPYGQKVEQEILPRLFTQLRKTSEYDRRRKEVDAFNKESKTHLKGLSLTAVKFGISFTTRYLNQGSALVNMHLDGTVQVSTGATEMGQGVNTKIAKVVADVFSIPMEMVRVMPTSTEKNHNTSPTAASSGSDINGAAAKAAAETIKKRIQLAADHILKLPLEKRGRMPNVLGHVEEIKIDESQNADHIVFENGFVYDIGNPKNKIDLPQLLQEVYLHRISLGAHGYFRYPGIHFNKETGKGEPFFYFTNGVGCSEVLIDRFTGEMKVQRVDILMDLGRPINEGIDYGQTTGAFVQGMGWVTTEKLYYDQKGALRTISPSTYKIPSVHDTPRDFRVEFLVNDENPRNVVGSKAVGEPPLLLGISVWTAIKNALSSDGQAKHLQIPASQEEILMNMPEEAWL